MLELVDHLQTAWKDRDIYELLMNLQGQVFREKEGRRTFRFEIDGKGYFAKVFMGFGWAALLACLLKFRKPIISAESEWRAIKKLPRIGVDTMTLVGYGKRGRSPARKQSFIITEELDQTISLEDFCRDWKRKPPPCWLKRALIKRVAQIARSLHENGIVHRDLYLCHFLLDCSQSTNRPLKSLPVLYLIDLHRAEQHRKLKERWRIKDVAGLFFSSMDIGLTQRDCLRFIAEYNQRPWAESLQKASRFWKQVERRGYAGYREFRRKNPELFETSDSNSQEDLRENSM